jgi:hypothetical protein
VAVVVVHKILAHKMVEMVVQVVVSETAQLQTLLELALQIKVLLVE